MALLEAQMIEYILQCKCGTLKDSGVDTHPSYDLVRKKYRQHWVTSQERRLAAEAEEAAALARGKPPPPPPLKRSPSRDPQYGYFVTDKALNKVPSGASTSE